MLVVVSPAKKLNMQSTPSVASSRPLFSKNVDELVSNMQKFSVDVGCPFGEPVGQEVVQLLEQHYFHYFHYSFLEQVTVNNRCEHLVL